jgi:rifampicin phosphotransferase
VTAADLDADGWEVALDEAVGELGGSRFAVRSSGAAEDLTDASYAGLYETYLNVPADELAQAVRRWFAAAGADRVQAYQERHGGSPAAMAVLVQAMVDPGRGRRGVHCPSGDRRPRSYRGHRRRRAG